KHLTIDLTYITSLNLDENTNLNHLVATGPYLEVLKFQNGNNSIIEYFVTTNSPNLLCIQVDDPAYSTANWTNVNEWTSFSEDCNYLKTKDESSEKFFIFPNPVKNNLNFSEA